MGERCVTWPCLLGPADTKASECHLIQNGEVWFGNFVVSTYPTLHPWEVQIWTGKKLPDHAEAVKKNVLVATRRGAGACRIRGADYDRDAFIFGNDARLLRFNRSTPDGVDMPELLPAVAEVREILGQNPQTPCQSVLACRAQVVCVAQLPRPAPGRGCSSMRRDGRVRPRCHRRAKEVLRINSHVPRGARARNLALAFTIRGALMHCCRASPRRSRSLRSDRGRSRAAARELSWRRVVFHSTGVP